MSNVAASGPESLEGLVGREIEAGGSRALVSWLNPSTLQIVWIRRGNADIVRAVNDVLIEVAAGKRLKRVLCDTVRVTDGYDVRLTVPATALFGQLRRQGMDEMVVVAKASAIRMLAYSFCLGIGLSVRVFADRPEAIRYCSA